ncbi:MAG: hypothetical protein L0211_25220 [Planctomycetaceae bacterium]|nr:hypothetical protein [Planctomycetaceae bacterium]
MLPEHLVAEYWEEVKRTLQQRHGMAPSRAAAAVAQFQDQALPKTGDMIYHAEAAATAATVKNWWQSRSKISPARTA